MALKNRMVGFTSFNAALQEDMSNYRRLFHPGGTYFFTINLADRTSDLLVRYIDVFRASYAYVKERHSFETVAAVVLPDHVHLMWTLPNEDQDFPKRIKLLKLHFTRRLPEREKAAGRKGERSVWQRRYWEHLIRDARDFEAHVGYIHGNPVKHGLVGHPDDWPYSTWHRWKKKYHPEWNLEHLKAGEP